MARAPPAPRMQGERTGIGAVVLAAFVVGAALLLFVRDWRDAALERVGGWFEEEELSDTEYWCPMDPTVVRPRPGSCPLCSMALVPRAMAGERAGADGVLVLSDRQIQQAGVRMGRAEVRSLVREIQTTGSIEVIPRKRTAVGMSYPGMSLIVALEAHATGDPVRKGSVRARVQNPELSRLRERSDQADRTYETVRREPPSRSSWPSARCPRRLVQFGRTTSRHSLLAASPSLRRRERRAAGPVSAP